MGHDWQGWSGSLVQPVRRWGSWLINFCSSHQCKGLANTAEMIEGSRFKLTAQSRVTEQGPFVWPTVWAQMVEGAPRAATSAE